MGYNRKILPEAYSPDAYRHLVSLLLDEGYATEPFTLPRVTRRTVFLRHDIDYSLGAAEEIAGINARLGARGTFFVQLRSPLYNAAAFETLSSLERIRAGGQHLALHLTLDEGCDDFEAARELLQRDWEAMRRLIPECQPVFAWHNPSLFGSGQETLMAAEFPGFVNAYGLVAGERVPYVADSNLRYSVAELEEIIRSGPEALQLALAPMQWCPGGTEMAQVLSATLLRRIREGEVEFLRNHDYRALYPGGLPEEVLGALREALLDLAERGASE